MSSTGNHFHYPILHICLKYLETYKLLSTTLPEDVDNLKHTQMHHSNGLLVHVDPHLEDQVINHL